MSADAKAVKVGEENYRLLRDIVREHGGTLKEHLENALNIYLGYADGTLAVRKPFGGKIELVNLLDLLECEDVAGSYAPVFEEFSPRAIEIFLKMAEKHVDENEPVLVSTIPPSDLPKYSPEYRKQNYRYWEEKFDAKRCFEYVMKGYDVNIGLRDVARNIELTLRYADIFPKDL